MLPHRREVKEMPEPDPREQQEQFEKQVHELQTQVRFLEDEVSLLRRRLTNAPRQVKLLVNVSPDVETDRLRKGAEVILNEALNVVEALLPDRAGEVVKVKDRLGEDRVIVIGRGDEELVATLGTALLDEQIRAGDPLLIDPRSNVVLEKLPKEE